MSRFLLADNQPNLLPLSTGLLDYWATGEYTVHGRLQKRLECSEIQRARTLVECPLLTLLWWRLLPGKMNLLSPSV